MPRKFIRLVLGTLLTTSSAHAMAQSAGWTVSEVRGPVTIVSAQGRAAATRGTAVHPGDTVLTGPDARAVLVHDKDFVTVAPNSRIRIPAEARGSRVTRFFQDIGNAIFNVEKRSAPHFSVDTPYLAAVVKGTVFSVTVGADRTALQVTEGVVEVSTSDGGARELIRPGSIAMIAASDRYRLTVSGDAARVVDSPARPSTPAPAQTPPAAATIESSAPPLPASTPEPSAPTAPAPRPDTVEPVGVRISTAVESKPVDLAAATNGVLTGLSPVSATAAVGLTRVAIAEVVEAPPRLGTGAPGPTDPVEVGQPVTDSDGPSSESSASPAPATGADTEKPGDKAEPKNSAETPDVSPLESKPEDKPDVGKPVPEDDKGTEPVKDDAGKPEDKPDVGKPDVEDDKGTEPGKDDAGKPEDKPDAGKPGAEDDQGAKPGENDAGKPGDKPNAGQPEADDDKGAKPDKDDADKPDAGQPEADDDKGGKPGKDDAGKPEDKPDSGKAGADDDKPGKDDAGKPEDKPDTGKPGADDDKGGKDDAGKPEDKPDTGKPGADDDKGGKPGKDDDDDTGSRPAKDNGGKLGNKPDAGKFVGTLAGGMPDIAKF